MENKKFTEWHGVPRKDINWGPRVDESKCIGCGMCVTSCGRGVYKFDYERKKSKVVDSSRCMVACQTCANICPVKAIEFTDGETTRDKAQGIIKQLSILQRVKKELDVRTDELELK